MEMALRDTMVTAYSAALKGEVDPHPPDARERRLADETRRREWILRGGFRRENTGTSHLSHHKRHPATAKVKEFLPVLNAVIRGQFRPGRVLAS